MYFLVHFLASSFPDEKLDTVWNHWLPVSTAMFCAYTKLAINAPKDGRGIGQKQVLEQNLSSTDVHGRTSVERYSGCTTVADGSNGLTASIFSRFLSTLLDTFTHLLKKCAKFYFLKMQQLNKIWILETVAFVREKRTHQCASFRKKTWRLRWAASL